MMSVSGAVDYGNVLQMRAGPALTVSTASMLHHHPLQSGAATAPLQFAAWETRESSPLSEDASGQLKDPNMERTLNFSTSPHDDEYGYGKKKTAPRDPMSHRIIEKRRRDRMNNCLADLSRLIPSSYLRKVRGRGRIEKTEIIEMAIKHIRYLQSKLPSRFQTDVEHVSPSESPTPESKDNTGSSTSRSYAEGYKDCFVELLQFLVDVEGFFVGEGLCSRLLNHTQNALDRMGHDIDLREHLPPDLLQPLTKSRRDSSIESEARIGHLHHHHHRGSQKLEVTPLINGHRPRALSQSDIRGIRITSDYDSEAEMHASGGSNSPNSSGNSGNSQSKGGDAESAASSQLKEMLQSPFHTWGRNYRPVGGQQDAADGKTEPASSTAAVRSASPTSTSAKDTTDAKEGAPYSFKRTIKERFKEELRRTSDPEIKVEESPILLGKRRPDSRSSGSNESIDREGSFDSFPADFVATAHKRRASGSPAVTSSSTVPIFALHSSGAYYVPSSLATHLIEFEPDAKVGPHSICHPVTINVNFSVTATTHSGPKPTSTSTPNLHPSSAAAGPVPTFPRPMFLTPQQAAASFLQTPLPFVPGSTVGSLPFICQVPGAVQHNATVIQSATSGGNMVMRRGSLPVTPASHHKEPVLAPIHYAFPTSHNHPPGPPPTGGNTTRTSPHILNLSQPHSRL
ncbi:uncharacterized protein LOC129588763 isoform X2 [Paramacrobiotus metropolitanus]|uniref:uncharacterized protein LOC129588763 isoform X2 n=1 Tax=Paramacrobiotus metropolitanus TaxID=2943436 RepID=UPI0024464D81|nr:uncharacterized protein LOC129588763 isoform X2 [Paramacrobiotus metropolitanus]